MTKRLSPLQTDLVAQALAGSTFFGRGAGETRSINTLRAKGYISGYSVSKDSLTEECILAFYDDNGPTFSLKGRYGDHLVFHNKSLIANARSQLGAEQIVAALKAAPQS